MVIKHDEINFKLDNIDKAEGRVYSLVKKNKIEGHEILFNRREQKRGRHTE